MLPGVVDGCVNVPPVDDGCVVLVPGVELLPGVEDDGVEV